MTVLQFSLPLISVGERIMYSLIKDYMKVSSFFLWAICVRLYAFPIFSMHFSSLSQKILFIFQSFQFSIFFNPQEDEEKDRNLVETAIIKAEKALCSARSNHEWKLCAVSFLGKIVKVS